MNREDYFVVVFGRGIASQTFNPDYLLLENVLKAIRRKERNARVYQVGIIPEAVPGVIRRLKERRSEYSGFSGFSTGHGKEFYLCWAAWASLQPITDEGRRISDPERLKQAERELSKFTKKGLKRLDDFYSAMVKADEDETSDSVVLVKVSILDLKETKKKELVFCQEGIWFVRADVLRKYPKELREAVTDLVVTGEDPAKRDDITHAIFKAREDAERAVSLLDDKSEEAVEDEEREKTKKFLRGTTNTRADGRPSNNDQCVAIGMIKNIVKDYIKYLDDKEDVRRTFWRYANEVRGSKPATYKSRSYLLTNKPYYHDEKEGRLYGYHPTAGVWVQLESEPKGTIYFLKEQSDIKNLLANLQNYCKEYLKKRN